MDDAKLEHMCSLAVIQIGAIRYSKSDPDDWIEYLRDSDDTELGNYLTCLSILAETCAELMTRAGIKPSFRVKSHLEPVS